MKALRKGSRGEDVLRWQEFLRGQRLYWGVCDKVFGRQTEKATKEFQRKSSLYPIDGIVGNDTYAAAMKEGFSVVASDSTAQRGPNWPPPPKGIRKVVPAERMELFGKMLYRPAPVSGNPEAIEITNDWVKQNIVKARIPELKQVRGVFHGGVLYGRGAEDVWCHRLFVEPLRATFAEWGKEGLVRDILTFDGLWVPRYIRGSRSVLSNHSYGTAIDINAAWNGFRCRPALVGQRGCVRELVPIANKNGLWWLGHTMNDGMHFELSYEAAVKKDPG